MAFDLVLMRNKALHNSLSMAARRRGRLFPKTTFALKEYQKQIENEAWEHTAMK
jgi:hypothetical protein